MKPSFEFGELFRAPARQYILRFIFGGVISVATGLIAKAWGPAIGGLLLAFPAVLPASLAFVSEEDGRRSAIEDARGSSIGASALMVFAILVWATAERWNPLAVLTTASVAWIALSWIGWALIFNRPSGSGTTSHSHRRPSGSHRRSLLRLPARSHRRS